MFLRPVARWLALAASLITAAVPTVVVARTVCTATGRAAVVWHRVDRCALGIVEDAPPCCDHGGERPLSPEREDCCKTMPALAMVSVPDAALPRVGPEVRVVVAWLPPDGVDSTMSFCGGDIPCRATGPPVHALRRHLGARHVTVLTI